MRGVLYFGDPQGALALLERGVELVGVVHGRPGGAGRQRLYPHIKDLPRWHRPDLNDPQVVAQLAALQPALIVAAFFPRIIPPSVLALAPGINVHPSDLPRWRGPDPCTWAIRAGDSHTAICVHWLTEGFDEGDVLLRERVAIEPTEHAGALSARLEARGAELIADVAARILAEDAPAATPQSGEVTWAPLVDDDDFEIDWTRPVAEVDALVRAAAPQPGAFTGLGDELLVILRGRPVEPGRFASLPPGSPFVRKGALAITCADGAYRLDRVRLGRRPMTGRALAELLA